MFFEGFSVWACAPSAGATASNPGTPCIAGKTVQRAASARDVATLGKFLSTLAVSV
ncbi:hypothetical protein MCA0487 [Methylococcus capsulatus str. Bath]|uniref:Uncharacterized protein n=1 Tax=Methylococcus capsulatus (strain ATCC 33009 / NCIMB 11132 / Bath) TaxID=243233 RepID=Q60BI5_METCA|nr:hypothetical protein MCA0487 [Methylococcus capsulatus str. Bath]